MSGKKTHSDKRGRRERGQALVEFALVVPIFLVLTFGIVDFGWALKSWITVTNASREGARMGAVHAFAGSVGECDVVPESETEPGVGGMPTIAARTCGTAAALDHDSASVAVSGADPDGPAGPEGRAMTGGSVVVTLTYRHDFITPLGSFIGGLTKRDCDGVETDLCIRSSADMRLE